MISRLKTLVRTAISAPILMFGASLVLPNIVLAEVPPIVAGGRNYNCALAAANGGVQCWGDGAMVTIATGAAQRNPAPVANLGNVVSISGGFNHVCALRGDGSVACWGDNVYGAVGDPDASRRSIPVQPVVSLGGPMLDVVAANYGDHTCALTTTFTLKCWGRNNNGQIGNGASGGLALSPQNVGGLSGVQSVSLGAEHTCAVTFSGAATCWGRGREGQLGNGTATAVALPVDVLGLAVGVRSVAAGFYHSCAVMWIGTVKCWGSNQYGELGNGGATGNGVQSGVPTDVVGISNAVAVHATRYLSCALLVDGGIKCWGDGFDGQLGNGNRSTRTSTAVTVTGLAAPAIALAVGGDNPCAVLVTGSVQCWGNRGFNVTQTSATSVTGLAVSTTVPMLEYRHTGLDYYFMTSNYQEKILLGTVPVFQPNAVPEFALFASVLASNTRPINRYYFSQIAKAGTRGSHFYTLVDAEKAALDSLNPGNADTPRLPQNEGIDSYAFVPTVEGVGGSCASGQRPVYRMFRGAARFPDDPNHRFTADISKYNAVVASGWDGEGVKFCTPAQ